MNKVSDLLNQVPFNERSPLLREGTEQALAEHPEIEARIRVPIANRMGKDSMLELFVKVGAFLADASEEDIQQLSHDLRERHG